MTAPLRERDNVWYASQLSNIRSAVLQLAGERRAFRRQCHFLQLRSTSIILKGAADS
jgi:hypothetical protein